MHDYYIVVEMNRSVCLSPCWLHELLIYIGGVPSNIVGCLHKCIWIFELSNVRARIITHVKIAFAIRLCSKKMGNFVVFLQLQGNFEVSNFDNII